MATVSLLEAATRYVASLQSDESSAVQAEVNRFVRWYGANRVTDELRGHDVSLYADELGVATPESKRRAEQVRGFLAFLKKEGMTASNFAPHLRLKKSAKGPMTSAAPKRQAVELTREGHEALRAELESLMEQRPQVREEIRRAMLDKDFRENAPLDAAKEKQGFLESRIRDIEATLKQAVVVEAGQAQTDEAGSRVVVGSTVQVTNVGSGARLRYTVVGANEGNASQGKITKVSPIGKALMGRREGDEVRVSVPAGDLSLRVEKIEG